MSARFNLLARTLVAFPLLAIVLVTVSGLIELSNAVRLGARQARVEAGLVAGSVRRELSRQTVTSAADSLSRLSQDGRLRQVLMDGLAQAPSVLNIAVIDTDGVAVTHTQPSLIGATVAPNPTLPEIRGFTQSLRVLAQLWRGLRDYQVEFPLQRGGRTFASVRITISGAFLREAVSAAAVRGLSAALVIITLAVLTGILLARLAEGKVRRLRAGISAMREGRFQTNLPETAEDEFGTLARELNLLGAQLERERAHQGERPPGAGGRAESAKVPPVHVDQSRVLAHLGETAAGVAHELRNHLQTVRLDLERLKNADRLPPAEVMRHVESASRGVESLGGAVRGFLKVARVRPPLLQPIQANDLLRRISEEMCSEARLAGVRLELDLDPAAPEIGADPEVLRPAILNLIRNGLQALCGREGRITLRSAVSGETIHISVADDGPGFPPEAREHAFELFYTTRTDGSGVGLAMVRQSAELHGGEVTIHTGNGGGSEVILTLPLCVARG